MRAPITLSLHLPNFNFPGIPPEGLFEHLVAIAGTAEESGFSSITVMDHLHQIGPVGPRENFMLEGNTILGALAARTSKVSVGLLVGGVTYRNPALMAKITTTLDIISGGRAILGIGAAWMEEEHNAYGFEFPPLKERFVHLEDALRICRSMFTETSSTVAGTYHSTNDALNNPRPLRGDIPILIGGSGERKTLRLVARYGDGCNIFGDVAGAKHLLEVLERHCEDVGRDPAEITKTRNGQIVIAESHDEAQRKIDGLVAAGTLPPERIAGITYGDPGEVAEQMQAFLDVGVEGLTFSMPYAHDLEEVALAGATLAPLVGSPVA